MAAADPYWLEPQAGSAPCDDSSCGNCVGDLSFFERSDIFPIRPENPPLERFWSDILTEFVETACKRELLVRETLCSVR